MKGEIKMAHFSYQTKGVCSRQIELVIEDVEKQNANPSDDLENLFK